MVELACYLDPSIVMEVENDPVLDGPIFSFRDYGRNGIPFKHTHLSTEPVETPLAVRFCSERRHGALFHGLQRLRTSDFGLPKN